MSKGGDPSTYMPDARQVLEIGQGEGGSGELPDLPRRRRSYIVLDELAQGRDGGQAGSQRT